MNYAIKINVNKFEKCSLNTMTDKKEKSGFYESFVEIFGEEKAEQLLGSGCDFKDWKSQARKYRQELEGYQRDDCMGAILEEKWQSINYLGWDREEFYSLGYSPLEVLAECVLGDVISYPPPEVLKVIAKQFRYYMLREGKVSLENAFFGDSRGRGVYAKRALSQKQKHRMYEKFEAYSSSPHGEGKSQEQILDELALIPTDPSLEMYEDGPLNPFRSIANETDDWIDSFLRDYRRWKNEFTK